jgi:hypothetical protein
VIISSPIQIIAFHDRKIKDNFATEKRNRRGEIPPPAINGHDGHPIAWLVWDYLKIAFRTVRDGHREICSVFTDPVSGIAGR